MDAGLFGSLHAYTFGEGTKGDCEVSGVDELARSASLDWLEYVQGIVKPLGLTCDVTSPCVFTAPGTVMIIYVDDLLIFSNKPDMGKKI